MARLAAASSRRPRTIFYRPEAARLIPVQRVSIRPILTPQTITTAEIGWRGKAGLIDLDVGTYYSWIKDEILVISDASGLSGYTRNADQTRHFGIELGGSAQILDDVGLRLAYTYQDFRFHDSDKYGNNRLVGLQPYHRRFGAL